MPELFASGRAVDLVVVFMAFEALGLLAYHRRTGRGLAPGQVAGNLLPGFLMLLALRAALTGAAWPWISSWLLASLAAHLVDLRSRWR